MNYKTFADLPGIFHALGRNYKRRDQYWLRFCSPDKQGEGWQTHDVMNYIIIITRGPLRSLLHRCGLDWTCETVSCACGQTRRDL